MKKRSSQKLLFLSLLSIVIISCKKNKVCSSEIPSENISCESINMGANVNGFIVNYYSGSATKESEGNYTDGVQTGFWKFYSSNGSLLKEINFENGKIKGFAKKYFENGNLEMEGNYTNCKRNGFWKFYHNDTDNLVYLEGNFENGIKSGDWKEYDNEGKLTKESKCN